MLAKLEAEGVVIRPTPATIKLIQDKLRQKEHFKKERIPIPDFMDVPDAGVLGTVGEAFGYPFMLKCRTGVISLSLSLSL